MTLSKREGYDFSKKPLESSPQWFFSWPKKLRFPNRCGIFAPNGMLRGAKAVQSRIVMGDDVGCLEGGGVYGGVAIADECHIVVQRNGASARRIHTVVGLKANDDQLFNGHRLELVVQACFVEKSLALFCEPPDRFLPA